MITEPTSGKSHFREFKLTTLALKNKNTIFLIVFLLAIFGILSYRTLPKELFPDIVIPTVLVKTIYPGNPPADMENLVTRILENEINTVDGIKVLRSTSTQDNSDIFVEFQTDVDIKVALQDVKDAIDRVKGDLPADLPTDPIVLDIDFSEFPIININLSGDFSLNELKRFADFLEEKIENIPEISKVEITGIDEREVQILVDPLKLDGYELGFDDIANAIAAENISMAGGSVLFEDNTRWAIRTIGEFSDIREMEGIIIKYEDQQIVYLRDVAQIVDTYADPMSFARLNDQPVVSLQVIKKSGQNLLAATNKVFKILDEAKTDGSLPANLNITVTNDQSEEIRNQLSNLENGVIMAVILVVFILYLFLGLKNALFVGLAIPLSMLISFMVFGLADIQINMIVLFSLILALGMLVDNSIVAVDNIFRFAGKDYSIFEAARRAIGEIAWPIITSTATTLAAFLPLAFWGGLVGEFMKYLPVTLIVVLTSSLFVALIIIPVFSYTFYSKKPDSRLIEDAAGINKWGKLRKKLVIAGILLLISVLFYLIQNLLIGNIFLLATILFLLGQFVFRYLARWFQSTLLPFNERLYERTLRFALKGRRPYFFVSGTLIFLIISLAFFAIRSPNVLFFPENDPKYINVLMDLPIGTDIIESNERARVVEKHIEKILEPYRHVVKSVLTTVGRGAVAEMELSSSDTPNRARITITFIEFKFRQGINTSEIMSQISEALIGKYPGIDFMIEKDANGPPTGKAVNLEISGMDIPRLKLLTDSIQRTIERAGITGIEGLSANLDVDNPEIIIHIDRDAARRFGVSTYAIANNIRTSLFGREVSTYKIGEEEFPIQLRLKDEYRHNLSSLLNQRITFRSQSTGRLMQVPITSVAQIQYSKTYGAINRIKLNRVITLSSNVLPGYNSTQINQQIREALKDFNMPEGYKVEFTGEQQEQAESMAFLINALLIAVALIALILVTQFNSILKPFIIIGSVVFSTAGVFFGLALFNMEFIIIMTGIGIVSLAGVVVNNAIVLIDYADYLHNQKKQELGVADEDFLLSGDLLTCIQEAGMTRFRPVILTAITTVLGLFPLALGLNFNFVTLFTNFNPDFYIGGDNAAFWGPMSWTIIFGLTVATFLTLVVVPAMYYILISTKRTFSLLKAKYVS